MNRETASLVIPSREKVDVNELFQTQKRYLDFFFEQIDYEQVDLFFDEVVNCSGVVVLAGVGKSGIIAQKIATTFSSSGTRALALSPTDALHGDLGIVSRQDLLILISKSGESDELLTLIPPLRNKGVRVLALVSNPDSRLAKASDCFVNLPLEKELCPFDLAPTTSAALQLIFGDTLAVALMKAKGFSLDEYAVNHPAGRIGKRITLRVRDLMLQDEALPVCLPDQSLGNLLVTLSDKKCGCLLVVDTDHRLLGIFTDGDLRRSLQVHGSSLLDLPVGDLMTENPSAIASELLAWEAVKVMESDQKRPVTVLPVVDEERVVGLIRMHDLIQAGV